MLCVGTLDNLFCMFFLLMNKVVNNADVCKCVSGPSKIIRLTYIAFSCFVLFCSEAHCLKSTTDGLHTRYMNTKRHDMSGTLQPMDDILTFSLHQKQRHYVRGTLCTTYVSAQCYAISRTITKITV